MICHFGNRLELLTQFLSHTLYERASLFSRPLVLLPHPAKRLWLQIQMAEQSSASIVSGVQMGYESCLLELALSIIKTESPKALLLNSSQLLLSIEHLLCDLRSGRVELSAFERRLLEPLLGMLSAKSERDSYGVILSLAQRYAMLLQRYGSYGGVLLKGWRRALEASCVIEPADWQECLWRKLKERVAVWHSPCELFDQAAELISRGGERLLGQVELPSSVHLFAFSFFSSSALRFLQRLSSHLPVHLYLLWPSQAFCGDLLSERGQTFLLHQLERQGATEQQKDDLEELFSAENSLVGNLSRLSRMMWQLLEAESADCYTVNSFALSDLAATHPSWQELDDFKSLHVASSSSALTLLEAIQSDMTLMRSVSFTEKIDFKGIEKRRFSSIQLCAAKDPWEEVAHLYDRLVLLLNNAEGAVVPADILVLCADLPRYRPYIEAVFGCEDSRLPFSLQEGSSLVKGGYDEALLALLDLMHSRWEVEKVVTLLEFSCFKNALGCSDEEAGLIIRWCRGTKVRWGLDAVHRQQLLSRDGLLGEALEQPQEGTWRHAFGLLLEGAVAEVDLKEWFSDEANDEGGLRVPPLQIGTSEWLLLGRWISRLEALYEALSKLDELQLHPLSTWVGRLQSLCELFLDSAHNSDEDKELRAHLMGQLFHIEQFASSSLLPFASLEKQLRSLIEQRLFCFREGDLNSVRFAKLAPHRCLPHQIIALIGFDEGFPHGDSLSGMDLLKGKVGSMAPKSVDIDRHLFAEVLHSTRSHLLISFSGSWQKGGGPPSVLVKELIDYLDSTYTVDGVDAGSWLKEEPSSVSEVIDFELGEVAGGLSFCLGEEKEEVEPNEPLSCKGGLRRFFTPPKEVLNVSLPKTLDIHSLQGQVCSPLRYYLYTALGVRPDRADRRSWVATEPFGLDYKEQGRLRKESLHLDLSRFMLFERNRGAMPREPFGGYYTDLLEGQMQSIEEAAYKLGVCLREGCKTMIASERFEEPFVEGDLICVPPLRIDLATAGSVALVGELKGVSFEGLLCYGKKSIDRLVFLWPYLLFYVAIAQKSGLELLPQLLLLNHDVKEQKVLLPDAERCLAHLKDLLFYGSMVQSGCVSPLLPAYVEFFLKRDVKGLQREVSKALQGSEWGAEPLLEWLSSHGFAFDAEELVEDWSSVAEALFGQLLAL